MEVPNEGCLTVTGCYEVPELGRTTELHVESSSAVSSVVKTGLSKSMALCNIQRLRFRP